MFGFSVFCMVFVIVVVVSGINMIGGGRVVLIKVGFSGVELLFKEMYEMKLRDDKVDYGDDKVSICLWFEGM